MVCNMTAMTRRMKKATPSNQGSHYEKIAHVWHHNIVVAVASLHGDTQIHPDSGLHSKTKTQ